MAAYIPDDDSFRFVICNCKFSCRRLPANPGTPTTRKKQLKFSHVTQRLTHSSLHDHIVFFIQYKMLRPNFQLRLEDEFSALGRGFSYFCVRCAIPSDRVLVPWKKFRAEVAYTFACSVSGWDLSRSFQFVQYTVRLELGTPEIYRVNGSNNFWCSLF
jgi:hypothetical protein